MGDPKWFGGDVTEGFAVGDHVNVRVSMLDASSDCWFCDDSEDPNSPLPIGGYVVQVGETLSKNFRCCALLLLKILHLTVVIGLRVQRLLPGP